jgi:hypothetical protein
MSDNISDLSQEEVWEAFTQALKMAHQNGNISKEVYEQSLKRKFPTHTCIRSAYKPAKACKSSETGYTQVRYRSVKYYCHRIAARIAGRPQAH